MMVATKAPGTPRSDGRTMPITAAPGRHRPVQVGRQRQRHQHGRQHRRSRALSPADRDDRSGRRQPRTSALPAYRHTSEANTVSSRTEPVSTSTYQPRMSVSISNAHGEQIGRPLKAVVPDTEWCGAEGGAGRSRCVVMIHRGPPVLFLVMQNRIPPRLAFQAHFKQPTALPGARATAAHSAAGIAGLNR